MKRKGKPAPAKAAGKKRPLAAQMKSQPKKPNPFELKGSKGHFDTMGRRSAGKKKNVIEARQEAVNRRKKTLLVEYRSLRKANTFVDRRFGEGDPEMSEADKGLGRLQRQRLKQVKLKKRGDKFTLADGAGGDGEGEELTHMGRSLADDIRNLMDKPEFDDLDEEMVEELVSQYHFGGGGEGGGDGAGGEGRGPDGKPKTRKQIMEEIIAKSKAYKALKAKQREEDEQELDKINDEFKQLVRSAALRGLLKAPGENKGVKVKAENPEDAAYDVAARELGFESKGAATEPTLTPEELLEQERQRLERLEKERIKRMRGGGGRGGDSEDEDEEDEDEEDEEEGGRRKRRKAHQSGDALGEDDFDSDGDEGEDDEGEDEDEEDEDDEEGGGKGVSDLDQRRMKMAAGDHPLQESFRATAAALAAKYGVQAKNPYLEEEEDEEEGEEDEEGESGDEGEEEEGESGSGEGEDDDEEEGEEEDEEDEDEEDEEEQLQERRHPKSQPSTSKPGADAAAQQQKPQRGQQQQQKPQKPAPVLDGPLDLPYTIPLPASYNDFAALVKGRPADQLATAIARIRAFNAVALATDNKRKMQEFFGILVQHFAMVAGDSPLPVASLDVLTRVLLELLPDVPYYAATVARARLARMADQLTSSLAGLGGAGARSAADAAGTISESVAGGVAPTKAAAAAAAAAAPASPWASSRVFCQLQLFTLMFPTSDRRHPVLTPQALLVGKYLNQCVVSNAHEAAVGLLLCGLMTRIAAPAHRVTPEVLVFYRDCLAAFVPPASKAAAAAAGAADTAAAAATANGAGAAGKAAGKGGKGKRKAEAAAAPAAAEAAAPAAAATSSASAPAADADNDDAFVRFAPGSLQLSGSTAAAEEDAPPVPQLDMYAVLGTSASDPRFATDAFKLSLMRVALCGVRRCAALASTPNPTAPGAAAAAKAAAAAAAAAEEDGEGGGGGGGVTPGAPYAGLPCFQQLFEPLTAAVAGLKRIERQLPAELQELRQAVHSQLTKTTAACVAARRPLVHPGRARAAAAAAAGAGAVIPAAAVREFNPRFEEDYVSGRDYDPDRQRSEQRRLKRQVTKERRGAIRELRRDAVFMAGERDREKAALDGERLESERRFYSELQRQEADLKSGGQAGMNPHLKKKKK